MLKIGDRHQRRTVVGDMVRKGKHRYYLCRCDCGNESYVLDFEFRATESCGCFQREVASRRSLKHGDFVKYGGRSPEYRSWSGAKGRVDGATPRYERDYKDRGIVMCAGWRNSYASFLADMGRRPSLAHTLDRIDNDGHYSCGKCDECNVNGWAANCRWSTEQTRNMRSNVYLLHNGRVQLQADWCRELGLATSYLIRYRKQGTFVKVPKPE